MAFGTRRRAISGSFLLFLGLTTSPATAQPAGTREALEAAQAAFAAADAKAERRPSKTTELELQSALDAYNHAVAARRETIRQRVNEIAGKERPVAHDTAPAPTHAPALRVEHDRLVRELRSIDPPSGFPGPWQTNESEPNNTFGTSDILTWTAAGYSVTTATITAADVDYFRFSASAGSRVWAIVDTGGIQSPPGNSRDSILALLDTDGTTALEVDDNDGLGNGLDGTIESPLASAIAGRTLPTDGIYFLQVSGVNAAAVIFPYRLLLFVTPPLLERAAEAEPNGTPLTATNLVGSLDSPQGLLGGALAAADEDFYAVELVAGNLVIASADLDPQRDGTDTNIALDLIHPNGVTVLVTANSASGSPFSESFGFTATTTGTHFVRVRQDAGVDVGNYDLAVSIVAGNPACPPPVISATLGQDTPDWPSTHGQQTGRLNRFVPGTSCAIGEDCPDLFSPMGLRTYDAYGFTNASGSTACVTVEINGEQCAATTFLFAAAYLNTFDPDNLCLNYLGDPGGSPGPLANFSFELPAGQQAILVFHEVTPAAGCGHYSFSVSGLGETCVQPADLEVDELATATTVSNVNGVLEAGERVLVAPAWKNALAAPLVDENFDNLTTPALPTGWVGNLAVGQVGDEPWETSLGGSHSPPNHASAVGPSHVTDNRLESPAIFYRTDFSSSGRLQFHHQFDFETGFDGGVLEISIDGAPFEDILDAGGFFEAGGYNGTIGMGTGSPIAGRQAWTGDSGVDMTTTVRLPFGSGNQPLVARWRLATDGANPSGAWNVDTVSFSSGQGLQLVPGTADGMTGPVGPTYTIDDNTAIYGYLAAGETENCSDGGVNCYEMTVSGTRPVAHWDAAFRETLDIFPQDPTRAWLLHIGESFSDVLPASGFYRFVETLFHNGVTGGCGGNAYCPSDSVLREQMAVFLLVSKEGIGYVPPACTTPTFGDVPCASPFSRWIEELVLRGVTAGCGGGNYCPADPVTREQMAVFLLVTDEGTGYLPPACTTPTFGDVPCASPFARWIEELVRRGITAGCGGGNFCPTTPVTREQMAVFLTVNFGLKLYGP